MTKKNKKRRGIVKNIIHQRWKEMRRSKPSPLRREKETEEEKIEREVWKSRQKKDKKETVGKITVKTGT